MSEQPQIQQVQLDRLNEFGKRFMELKGYLLKLNLDSHENVRMAVEHLDDGFLRGREAICAVPMVSDMQDDTVPEEDKVANDPAPVPVEEIPLAASN